MPSITLTLPVAGTNIAAGLHASNYSALQTLLNGGLDNTNLSGSAAIALTKIAQTGATTGQAIVWNGSAWAPATPANAGFTQGARVYNSAAQSIPNAAWTAITFNTERFDTDTIHDTGSNTSRLTCKTAGKYMIGACIAIDNADAADRQIRLLLNGTTEIAREGSPTLTADSVYLTITSLYDLAVNDYVEVQLRQNTTGARNTVVNANSSPEFWIWRVG